MLLSNKMPLNTNSSAANILVCPPSVFAVKPTDYPFSEGTVLLIHVVSKVLTQHFGKATVNSNSSESDKLVIGILFTHSLSKLQLRHS